MRRAVLAGFVCAAALWTFGQAQEQPKYAPLFEALWSTVNDNFYDPNFHGVDWKKVGVRYRAKLAAVTTDTQFKTLANQMLDELGTSHLYASSPSLSSASGVGIGVEFRTIGGEELVASVAPLVDARDKGLQVGERIISPAEFTGPAGSLATLRVESCDGRQRDVVVKRAGAFWPPPHPGFTWWQVHVGPKRTIGYLRIDRFDDGAADLVDQAMDELKDTDALVIDVRDNSGGNMSALRLSSYFSGKEQIGIALFAREYLKTVHHVVSKDDVLAAPHAKGAYTDAAVFKAVTDNAGRAAFMTDDMGTKGYTKPVVVLIGEDTGSAGEGFAWAMRTQTKAKLVGRTTAGALLSGERFELPGGWKVTVPVQGLWGADGTDYRDRAVVPDIAVSWTRADLCSGRDPDLSRAMALLAQP